MIMQNIIQTKLHEALEPVFFDVVNESHIHNVPPGSESHFKIIMVTNKFKDMPLIKRHKMIYGALEQEMKKGVHALALHTLTPEEYENRHGQIPGSPLCQGGDKG